MTEIYGAHAQQVLAYARRTIDAPWASEDEKAACRRFLADLEDPRWSYDPTLPEVLILTSESLF